MRKEPKLIVRVFKKDNSASVTKHQNMIEFFSGESCILHDGRIWHYDTRLSISIPPEYILEIVPCLTCKELTLLNSPLLISGRNCSITLSLYNAGKQHMVIQKGDLIAIGLLRQVYNPILVEVDI